MPTFEDKPKGSAVITVRGLPLLVSESVAARLVEQGIVRLCGHCPAYHMTKEVEATMTIAILSGRGLAMPDLREHAEVLPDDPDLATKIAGYGKAKE